MLMVCFYLLVIIINLNILGLLIKMDIVEYNKDIYKKFILFLREYIC